MANNIVNLSTTTNTITVTWYSRNPSDIQSEVLVGQLSPDIIQINSPGPKGNAGVQGPKGDPGALQSYQDLDVTGGITTVTGSLNSSAKITAGQNVRSIELIPGSGELGGFSPRITSNYSRIEFQKDIFMGLHGGGLGPNPTKIFFDSSDTFIAADANNPENLEIHADNDIELRADGIVHANSIISASGFTGSLEGTASFSTTSSFALNVPPDTGFPFTGSAQITGSLDVTGPITSSGVISASEGFTGSLEGTSSFATTASFALNVPPNTGFPFTGQAEITGGLNVTQTITASAVSSSGTISGSAFYGNGQFLSGIGSNPFPYTGSALVSGSFAVTGSFGVHSGSFSADTGSFLKCNAEQFVSTGTGVPKISSATKLILSASTSVQIENLIRLNPTTTESITAPENGSIICDSNTNKFRGYINGAWVDFH